MNVSGVGFFLNGVHYANNSVVSLAAMGKGSAALYCLTDLTACCREEDGDQAGEWMLPGTQDTTDFHISRAPSAVLLNRVNSSTAERPTGIYTCLIPDSTGHLKTLYIGLDTSKNIERHF